MIRINQIKLGLEEREEKLKSVVSGLLHIKEQDIEKITIVKKSIDARKKPDLKYVYGVDVKVKNENKINKKLISGNISRVNENKYILPKSGDNMLSNRPVIVGMGPAGLFCGYYLASMGYKPLIIERGKDVDRRTKDVENFWEKGILSAESNVQFGEGGAGTFSDGKLNTMVKDKFGRNKEVLKTFVKFGAKPEIMYVNKPHIGTDVLKNVVKNMRNAIIELGGEVRFDTKLTDIEIKNGKVIGITVNDSENIPCEALVLALGHSARDTFGMLLSKKMSIEAKAFAVGLRIEHPQEMINNNMYGMPGHELLEAADYKVTYNTSDGRGVYSFCMCPGGYVVNASSEQGHTAVNGMSYSGRDGQNANSAIIVTVSPEDYGDGSPLSGVVFQRSLEKKSYEIGKGKIPVQCYVDFENNRMTEKLGEIVPQTKGQYTLANLREIFPEYINSALIEGIHGFSNLIENFDREDAVLSGVESRTSSPIRILRNEELVSNIGGIYPCGEGAGYAGGITSAAMDGIRVFEAIAGKYSPLL